MKKYLAIDIGGTFIKYSIMDEMGYVYDDRSQATKREPEQFLQQIKDIVKDCLEQVEGIAICMAGFIDPETGENTDFSVGENFRAYNLKKELEAFTGMKVVIENDSNCAVLGEMCSGAGKGFQNICLLTLGTGIGAGIVSDGKLMRGSHFKAGEAGMLRLCTETEKENFLESAGATSALVREVSRILEKEVDGFYIFHHLEEEKIANVYRKWLEKIALTAGNMAMILDPEILLIGGGVCSQKKFIEDLRECIYRLYPHLEEYTDVQACATGNMAGRIGALYLFSKEEG